jgi:hypothetical protein
VLGFAINRRHGDDQARQRVDWTVVVACLVLAIGVAILVFGVLGGVTGDERAGLPEAVESVTPVPEAAQALSQTAVFVDLLPDYYGHLTIDGVEIETRDIADVVLATPTAGAQVELPPVTIYEAGNATLTYTPAAGAPIEEFDQGLHTVRLTYWPISEGASAARTFTWTFEVV